MQLLRQTIGYLDPFWQLNAGDYVSLLGLLISIVALAFAVIIYTRIRKQERAHIVNSLKLTHALLNVVREHIQRTVRDYSNNEPTPAEKLVIVSRFMRDFHPIFTKHVDRIERALDPIRLHIDTQLNDRLNDTLDYLRIVANPDYDNNRPILRIPEAANTWFNSQRELVNTLAKLQAEIRKVVPEISAPE